MGAIFFFLPSVPVRAQHPFPIPYLQLHHSRRYDVKTVASSKQMSEVIFNSTTTSVVSLRMNSGYGFANNGFVRVQDPQGVLGLDQRDR